MYLVLRVPKRGRSGFMALLRRSAAWCLWAAVLFWWWMLLVGEWDHEEWIAAAAAAAIGATVAEGCRAAAELEFRFPLERIARAPAALAMVLVDLAIVLGVLSAAVVGRPVRGRFIHRRPSFPLGGLDARSVGRRALTILVAGYSPNAYVVDLDRRNDRALLHDLVTNRKSEEPA
jgi:hypothetical protein